MGTDEEKESKRAFELFGMEKKGNNRNTAFIPLALQIMRIMKAIIRLYFVVLKRFQINLFLEMERKLKCKDIVLPIWITIILEKRI